MYFKGSEKVFLDGNWVEANQANATLFSQTMHYGYGVFDGMRSYKNADGSNIYRAKDHYERLIKSAKELGLNINYSAEELVSISYKLLNTNKLQTAYIRPLIFTGPNMELTSDSDVHLFIGAWKWKKYLGYQPIDVMVSQFVKPVSKNTPIKGKIVGNYTYNIMASSQAKKLGYDEALMLDEDNFISEGPAANFFYEKDGVLFTPTTKHALNGITRKSIIALAKEWGVEVVEKDITVEEVYKADHAFFTGTATEVTPIGTINGEKMSKTWEESAAYTLYMMYRQQVMHDEFLGLTIV